MECRQAAPAARMRASSAVGCAVVRVLSKLSSHGPRVCELTCALHTGTAQVATVALILLQHPPVISRSIQTSASLTFLLAFALSLLLRLEASSEVPPVLLLVLACSCCCCMPPFRASAWSLLETATAALDVAAWPLQET